MVDRQGRGRRTHVIGAMVWTLERSLPRFMLTPRGFWDTVSVLFGGQDIAFADDRTSRASTVSAGRTKPPCVACLLPRCVTHSRSIRPARRRRRTGALCGGVLGSFLLLTGSSSSSWRASASGSFSSPIASAPDKNPRVGGSIPPLATCGATTWRGDRCAAMSPLCQFGNELPGG